MTGKLATEKTDNVKKIKNLAKFDSIKVKQNNSNEKTPAVVTSAELEIYLIQSTRLILREYGIRKSGAAVRDAIDTQHQSVGARDAVSALDTLGVKASFGRLNLKNLSEDFFPLIAFKKNGQAYVINTSSSDGQFFVTNPLDRTKTEISISDYLSDFSQYVILAKELNSRELEERSGHWFFSAFRKSKWIYVQVMMAAMVSNFLSLTTALFTMTVYDRVIPNGAFNFDYT